MTVTATVRLDLCFKGTLNGQIVVASDEYRPPGGWRGGWHIFTPEPGEYLLLFLKDNIRGKRYEVHRAQTDL